MKLSKGTRSGDLKPGSNKLVMKSLPEQSCEIEVEFSGKRIIGYCSY